MEIKVGMCFKDDYNFYKVIRIEGKISFLLFKINTKNKWWYTYYGSFSLLEINEFLEPISTEEFNKEFDKFVEKIKNV